MLFYKNNEKINYACMRSASIIHDSRTEYERKISFEQSNLTKWNEERTFVTKALDNVFSALSPDMKERLDRIYKKGVANAGNNTKCNYDKLLYYIDQINEIDIPQHIIDKNPKFCETVLTVAVEEFQKIKNYLSKEKDNKKEQFSQQMINIKAKYTKKAGDEWENLTTRVIPTLVNEQVANIIKDIKNSI